MTLRDKIQTAAQSLSERSREFYKLTTDTFESALSISDALLEEDYRVVSPDNQVETHRKDMATAFHGSYPGIRHWMRRFEYPDGQEFVSLGFYPYPQVQNISFIIFYLNMTTAHNGIIVTFGNNGKTAEFTSGDWLENRKEQSMSKLHSLMGAEFERIPEMLTSPDTLFSRAFRMMTPIKVGFAPSEPASFKQKRPIGFSRGNSEA